MSTLGIGWDSNTQYTLTAEFGFSDDTDDEGCDEGVYVYHLQTGEATVRVVLAPDGIYLTRDVDTDDVWPVRLADEPTLFYALRDDRAFVWGES